MGKLGFLLGAGAVGAAAETLIAGYFFRRTLLRSNAKTDRTQKMAGTDWNKYMPAIRKNREWLEQQKKEKITLISADGLKLSGTFFPGENKGKIIVGFHGYTSRGMNDFVSLSKFYLNLGYSVLLPDARAHGDSEGTYIGFGCLDRFDARRWIRCIDKRFHGKCRIILHGISMGGATVLMTGGLNLPDSVKGIISDCGFTSAWDVFSFVLKSMYHLPPFPILHLANQMAKREAGYGMDECSAKDEVRLANVPILLIHGESDTFVPSYMCEEIYKNCASSTEMLLIKGAGHAESYYKEQQLYEKKLKEFLEKLGV